jgi:hypothetical protein
MVAVSIALAVLHMTDQSIGPIAKPVARRQDLFAGRQDGNACRWNESSHPDFHRRS